MQSKSSRNERVKALHDRLIASVEELVSSEESGRRCSRLHPVFTATASTTSC